MPSSLCHLYSDNKKALEAATWTAQPSLPLLGFVRWYVNNRSRENWFYHSCYENSNSNSGYELNKNTGNSSKGYCKLMKLQRVPCMSYPCFQESKENPNCRVESFRELLLAHLHLKLRSLTHVLLYLACFLSLSLSASSTRLENRAWTLFSFYEAIPVPLTQGIAPLTSFFNGMAYS